MWDNIRGYVVSRWHYLSSTFASKKPHFNFITAHYIWIISGTILASILIYASGPSRLSYTDALMFASGVNTQAGLNPVDVNKLNIAQQIIMYIFPMMSNPITLHSSVVVLRLYWFEKRFQGLVKDAKLRRPTLTRTKSKAHGDIRRAEEGVNGRNITVVSRQSGTSSRMTNDGLLIHDDNPGPKPANGSDGSESIATITNANGDGFQDQHPDVSPAKIHVPGTGGQDQISNLEEPPAAQSNPAPATSIKFADTVKRSDDIDDDPTQYVRHRSNTEHIAILERQRHQDNEVLRIPGPRDIEKGLGPRRLNDPDDQDDNNTLAMTRTRESRPDHATIGSNTLPRNPTITIEEPNHPRFEQIAEDANAATGTLDALRFRKPRMFNRSQDKVHEDAEEQTGPEPEGRRARSRTISTIKTALSRDKVDDMPYLSYTPTMGRNSNFVGLTLEQREELGGVEYRSLRTLAFILLGYFWGFQVLGFTVLLPYILQQRRYRDVVTDDGISPTWWAFFTANVSFMDVGFTLTPDSMISFQTSQYVLMFGAFFIIIGNTAFPVMLRFIIWAMSKIVPKGSGLWEELKFLLDHPRRCFTLLFPSRANWWLFWILVLLNVIDLIFFIILDLNSQVVEDLSGGTRVVNGIYIAASTRTAGFSSLPLADLHPAMPVLYMIMMYISVFPIAISIRRTNVYEEQSLGVYHSQKDEDDNEDMHEEDNTVSYVSHHLRRQLSFDLWYVFLGFFLLAIAEGGKLKEGKFSMFDVLFEIVSAYGTVGLSIGVPYANASLSSQFSVVGKLIIIAMEIRGRHRGLPYGLDRAVILPSESRFRKEAEEMPTIARTNTGASATMSGARRRDSSTRGRSLSRERDRRIVSRFLHPGPAIPPGVVHSHNRNKSNASDALSVAFSGGSRRPQSYHTAFEDDEAERADGLAPLRPIDSRPQMPRRADTSPQFTPVFP